jgi:hypothetical protein
MSVLVSFTEDESEESTETASVPCASEENELIIELIIEFAGALNDEFRKARENAKDSIRSRFLSSAGSIVVEDPTGNPALSGELSGVALAIDQQKAEDAAKEVGPVRTVSIFEDPAAATVEVETGEGEGSE